MKTKSNFICLPQYQYRIRTQGKTESAYLTRGQFNKVGTGSFIGFMHTLNHKDIDVLVKCETDKCNEEEFWTELDQIEDEHLPICDNCGKLCQPVTTSQ